MENASNRYSRFLHDSIHPSVYRSYSNSKHVLSHKSQHLSPYSTRLPVLFKLLLPVPIEAAMTTGSSSRSCDRRPSSRRKTSAINVSCRLHYQRGTERPCENASSAILWLHVGCWIEDGHYHRRAIDNRLPSMMAVLCVVVRIPIYHKRQTGTQVFTSQKATATKWSVKSCQMALLALSTVYISFALVFLASRGITLFLWRFLWKYIFPLRAMRKPVVRSEFLFPLISSGCENRGLWLYRWYYVNLEEKMRNGNKELARINTYLKMFKL